MDRDKNGRIYTTRVKMQSEMYKPVWPPLEIIRALIYYCLPNKLAANSQYYSMSAGKSFVEEEYITRTALILAPVNMSSDA
jgi:hypothetical protein